MTAPDSPQHGSPPALRQDGEKETLAGILGPVRRTVDWVIDKPRRIWGAIIVLLLGGAGAILFLAVTNPDRAFKIADDLSARNLEAEQRTQVLIREELENDRFIRNRIEQLRNRLFAARSVVRAYVFDRNSQERVIGIVNVFESMDPMTENTGIRDRPLPLESINQTLNYMSADPGNPRCIAANTEDYDDPELRAFLSAGGLEASAACPILNRNRRVIGLLAVSVRSPLEENPELVPRTRDASLELRGYLERSSAMKIKIEQARKAQEND